MKLVAGLAALALTAACSGSGEGGGGGDDERVDEIVANYEKLGVTDAEVDEFRDQINDALDTLPESEHDEYLDTLAESTKQTTDAVKEGQEDPCLNGTDHFDDFGEYYEVCVANGD